MTLDPAVEWPIGSGARAPASWFAGVRKSVKAALTTAVVAVLAVPLLATPAAAAASATVTISQATTVPAVSVDQGGSVTFVNSIPARTDLLGVTLATDVTVVLPSGSHPIAPGASFTETFQSSCLTCTVTYKYRVSSGLLPPLAGLPGLPASLPMVVNTIVPLPNLPVPAVNVPSVPLPNLPVPGLPVPPVAGTVPVPGTTPPAAGAPTPQTGGTTNTGVTVGEQVMPNGGGPLILGAPNGFADRRTSGSSGPNAAGSGSGTGISGYDGAEPPIFGVLEGLEETPTAGNTGVLPFASQENEPIPDALGAPALLAVLLLSVVSAGLVRNTALARRTKKLVAETSA